MDYLTHYIISYHIFIFTKHAKKHINRHVKGENSQKAKKRPEKGYHPTKEKKLHQIYQQKKATQERKINLHYPSLQTLHETKSTTHQAHHYPTLTHTPHTLTQKQDKTKQNKNKTSKQAKLQK